MGIDTNAASLLNMIQTTPKPNCPICGAAHTPLYQALRDRLFSAPGEWSISRCPTCGLLWLNPQPLERDILKAYQTYYTHDTHGEASPRKLAMRDVFLARRYGYPLQQQLTQQLLGILSMFDITLFPWIRGQVMYLPAVQNGRLLDVGCGAGEFMTRMQSLGWHPEGLDLDPQAVRTAQANGLQVQVGTVSSAAYPDNTFDAITMSHVIEHLYDPLADMRECYRILKPGGTLVIITPNNASLVHRLMGDAWRGLEPPRHLQIFGITSMQRVAAAAGFQQARVFSTVRGANYLYAVSTMVKRHGRYQGESFPKSLRLTAKALQWVEWFVRRIDPHAGEELVIIGRK